MKLNLITCSSKTPPWLNDILSEYQKKISFWFPFSFVCLRSPAIDRDQANLKKDKESQLFLREIRSDDFVIACDENGKEFDSLEFAKRFENILGGGKKRVVFLVGGAYGHSEDILKRADLKLSLAPFTMNHHLACAVTAEQIYRSLTIIKGVTYHN